MKATFDPVFLLFVNCASSPSRNKAKNALSGQIDFSRLGRGKNTKNLVWTKGYSEKCLLLQSENHLDFMEKEEKVQYWIGIAEEDLDVAEDMHKTKHWLYVAFMCHQVMEKLLKAYWSQIRDDLPPYTHSHIKLLDECGLLNQMSEEQLEFVDFMVPMNIEARYPEYKQNLSAHLNEKTSFEILDKTKQFKQWILQKF